MESKSVAYKKVMQEIKDLCHEAGIYDPSLFEGIEGASSFEHPVINPV